MEFKFNIGFIIESPPFYCYGNSSLPSVNLYWRDKTSCLWRHLLHAVLFYIYFIGARCNKKLNWFGIDNFDIDSFITLKSYWPNEPFNNFLLFTSLIPFSLSKNCQIMFKKINVKKIQEAKCQNCVGREIQKERTLKVSKST